MVGFTFGCICNFFLINCCVAIKVFPFWCMQLSVSVQHYLARSNWMAVNAIIPGSSNVTCVFSKQPLKIPIEFNVKTRNFRLFAALTLCIKMNQFEG